MGSTRVRKWIHLTFSCIFDIRLSRSVLWIWISNEKSSVFYFLHDLIESLRKVRKWVFWGRRGEGGGYLNMKVLMVKWLSQFLPSPLARVWGEDVGGGCKMGFENFAEGGCPFLEGAPWKRGGQFSEERRGPGLLEISYLF